MDILKINLDNHLNKDQMYNFMCTYFEWGTHGIKVILTMKNDILFL